MKALVTGASEGIGRCFALELAKAGYQVTVVARNEERLKSLVSELNGSGHSHLVADLSTPEGTRKIASALEQGSYNLLVNNAGFGFYSSFFEVKIEKLLEMTRLNCDSLMILSHAFLGKSKPGDALINVSSVASFLPMPITSVYTASKAFVTSLSECVWYEAKKRGIYVMALCPGATHTQFHTRAGGKNDEMPPVFSQTPEQVVALALKELRHRRKPIVISGPSRYLWWFAQLFPRKWVVRVAGLVTEKQVQLPS